ncbi:MAG: hypothetical protein ABSH16_02040 [Sedimentisphaerales bacterium]
MNYRKEFLFIAFFCIAVSGIVSADSLPNPNLNNDNIANFYDFAIFANNWQQTGTGLAGDFDDSNTVDIDDLTTFCWYWLSQYSQYQQCQGTGTDLDNDGIIAFEDLAKFAQNWLLTGTGLTGDFDKSNSVDCNDLSIFADCWLKGSKPESIWEQFKAALAAGDVNTALTFVLETSREKYAEIFQVIGSNLPDFAAGIGTLILQSQDEDTTVYEMTHQDGDTTYSFPVIFIKDSDGNWKIYNF